ncbi:MAG: LPS export ABC transporter permease LptF [Pseudomonadota bacterium]
MIFQRALRRELVSAAGATFTVLFTILTTFTLFKIVGLAAGGKVASSDVLALMAFAALNYLPIVVILTSFISVLAVVTRSYRDSEMVVWFASGQSLTRWIWPVLRFALPLVLLTAFLSLFATPWAKSKSHEFIERFEKREDVLKVSPGQFKESSANNSIFFVEGASGDTANVSNVFYNTLDKGGTTVVVAKQGSIETNKAGDRFLVLRNGRRYQGTPGRADFQSMEFERYTMRVSTQVPVLGGDISEDRMPTEALVAASTKATLAELSWRIALPMTCMVLSLLAIPLGFVNPRAGSSANLIIALLIFITYYNLMGTLEASIKQSKLSFGQAWWPLHTVAALCVLGLFVWRLNVNHRYHPMVLWAAFKRGALAKRGAAGARA